MRISGQFRAVTPLDKPTPSAQPRAEGPKPQRHPLMHHRDREFLPAALEILETPPSPLALAMMAVIGALVATALAWSWFGKLDIYATARGKFVPHGYTKVI